MTVIKDNTWTIGSVFIVLGGCCFIIAGTYPPGDIHSDIYSVQAFKFCAFALFSLACAIHFFLEKVIYSLCAFSALSFFVVAILYWALDGNEDADVKTNMMAFRSLSFAPLCIAVITVILPRYLDRGVHWNSILIFGCASASAFVVSAVMHWMEESTSNLFYAAGFGLFSIMMAVYAHIPTEEKCEKDEL